MEANKWHNFLKEYCGWGHNISMAFPSSDGKRHSVRVGHAAGIKVGDSLIFTKPGTNAFEQVGEDCMINISRFVVESIDYKGDPPDMFSAELVWKKISDQEWDDWEAGKLLVNGENYSQVKAYCQSHRK